PQGAPSLFWPPIWLFGWASHFRRSPSLSLGSAGDSRGKGAPETLTVTRNPPTREFLGLRSWGTAAPSLFPAPGRRGRDCGQALPGPPQSPQRGHPSPAGTIAPWLLPPPGCSEDLRAPLSETGPNPNALSLGRQIPSNPLLKDGMCHLKGWVRQERTRKEAGPARRNQCDFMLLRNQQLCSTCQEIKMVQPRTMKIPDDPKVSFENFMSYRMSFHQPKFQTTPEPFHDDIPTESIHYRLPILGPRTAVFHGLLTEAYKTLKERQRSSLPRKEPIGKTMRQ
uniref:Uncharacterized protein n=1 Tax=Pongo abelii TaxID=9601 RepID=A0A8I5TB29_PONAB